MRLYFCAGLLLAFFATFSGSHTQQTWAYNYHSNGQIETADGPRTDVTAYSYDGAGNVSSIANALSYIIQNIKHDGLVVRAHRSGQAAQFIHSAD